MKGADGEYPSDFIGIKAFGKTAEFIYQYFGKGSAICVEGEIQTSSWTDKDGNKRYSTDIIANNACFVDSAAENTAVSNDPYNRPQTAPAAQLPKFEQLSADDDLPF